MLTTLNKEASPEANILVRVRDPPFPGGYRNKNYVYQFII